MHLCMYDGAEKWFFFGPGMGKSQLVSLNRCHRIRAIISGYDQGFAPSCST
jgi:hypothetical protein